MHTAILKQQFKLSFGAVYYKYKYILAISVVICQKQTSCIVVYIAKVYFHGKLILIHSELVRKRGSGIAKLDSVIKKALESFKLKRKPKCEQLGE